MLQKLMQELLESMLSEATFINVEQVAINFWGYCRKPYFEGVGLVEPTIMDTVDFGFERA